MNSVRYYLAMILLVTVPPAIPFWLIVHTFIRFWRRLGPRWTFSLVGTLMGGAMIGLFLIRKPLLAMEFGTRYPLIVLGVSCLACAIMMLVRVKKCLSFRIQVGLPELAPDRTPGKLLTEGVYARIRHPRYVGFLLALIGYALIANYLATYIVFALCLPGFYLVVILEERELRERFGQEYEEYCRRVPRFVPRLRGCL
jgi:protein-S-isoprenylcysteine O-methyltransferase Ste14